MTYHNLRRGLSAALVAALLATLVGCSDATVSLGELETLQQIAASCPADAVEHHQDRVDVSGSGERGGLTGTTREIVAEAITRTAICGGGTYSLVVFSAGTAHTAPVFEGVLSPPGATETAQLRRLPELLEKTLSAIDVSYPGAVARLTDGATDVVAQLSGAAEFASQVHASSPDPQPLIFITIRTDGIGTVGAGALPSSVTAKDAIAAADQISVPDLSGVANLTFSGIGQVASGDAPSSAYVEALKAFYQRLGERAGASQVSVFTEHVSGR